MKAIFEKRQEAAGATILKWMVWQQSAIIEIRQECLIVFLSHKEAELMLS